MIVDRRKLLRLVSSGLALAASSASPAFYAVAAANDVKQNDWKITCKTWLNILMPPDTFGAGADSPEVWENINQLVEDKNFREGFISGMEILAQLVVPPNDSALTELMSQDTPISQFLNAFFEIVIESYYGAKIGWKDIGVMNAPQPFGYTI